MSDYVNESALEGYHGIDMDSHDCYIATPVHQDRSLGA